MFQVPQCTCIALCSDNACALLCTQIGQIMHTDGSPWRLDGSMGGVMLVPVAFAMIVLLGAAVLLTLFLALQV